MKRQGKKGIERSKGGAARRGSPIHHRLRCAIGDRVRIVDIPADLKDPNYDMKDSDHREMRTAELFRFCLGHVFTVYGFDQYGHVELSVTNSSTVRKRFGNWHTIWMSPSSSNECERPSNLWK